MPVSATIKKNIGESGYADVRIGKKNVRITFDSGIAYEIEMDQWEKDRKSGKYNVTMAKDGTKPIGIRPIAGSYVLRYAGMSGKVDGVPEPVVQRGGPRHSRDGKSHWIQPDSLAFKTVLEVESEGLYQGLKVYHNVPYIFSVADGGAGTKLEASSKKELERVEIFLRVNGFDLAKEDIPYSTNVLPWLDKKLMEVSRPFLGNIAENGFINTMSELPRELYTKKGKNGK